MSVANRFQTTDTIRLYSRLRLNGNDTMERTLHALIWWLVRLLEKNYLHCLLGRQGGGFFVNEEMIVCVHCGSHGRDGIACN